jgi:hypothetical protein
VGRTSIRRWRIVCLALVALVFPCIGGKVAKMNVTKEPGSSIVMETPEDWWEPLWKFRDNANVLWAMFSNGMKCRITESE